MKPTLLIGLLFIAPMAPAQITISAGASLVITGNKLLTLNNAGFVNNGNFTAGTGTVRFSGNADAFIRGDNDIQFNELELAKSDASQVQLEKNISVMQGVVFNAGFLNLNGFNVDLGTTGRLEAEAETSHVVGSAGGEVFFTANLNAPANSNPANLGLTITSTENLGAVTIRRGHQSQNSFGLTNSILRYYTLTAQNNAVLNATLRFNYFERELNNFSENSLVIFEKQGIANFTALGVSTRNAAANFVEKGGINSLERFTLSASNAALPVKFISFSAKCDGDKVGLIWKTAQEQNSDHFNVERSTDGLRFISIASLPAAMNSTREKSYSFTDAGNLQNAFYRIAEYDSEGKIQYTAVIRTSCGAAETLSLSANPAHNEVFMNILSATASKIEIKLFDNKGALIKLQQANLIKGSNILRVDLHSLTNGIYHLSAAWNNGQSQKYTQLLKQ